MRLQHLQERLLDQPIRHRRDAKLALATVRLRDRHPSYRLGRYVPDKQLFADRRPRRHADARPSGRCPARPCPLRPCWPVPASTPVAGSLSSMPPQQPRPCALRFHVAGAASSLTGSRRGFTARSPPAPLAQASDALLCRIVMASNTPPRSALRSAGLLQLLRPLLTSRSGSTPSPFQA